MSMGYGGMARLALEDEYLAIYEYFPYNLNDSDGKNKEPAFDGVISIMKCSLVEADVRVKRKRLTSGRIRLTKKRIRKNVNFESLINDGKIVVSNSRFSWRITDIGIDMIAMYLLHQIYNFYQDEGELPPKVTFYV